MLIESLNLSAASAISLSIVAEYPLSASLPSFNIGIILAPDLPNISIANAVFSTPSGILENLSAKSSMMASTPRILPCASVELTPIDFNASLVFDAGSTMPLASLPIDFATSSKLLPLSLAALPNLSSVSTPTPVRWLKSFKLSAASIDRLPKAPRPANPTAGTNPPNELVKPPAAPLTRLNVPCKPPACLSTRSKLFSNPLMDAMPSTLAWIFTAAFISSAMINPPSCE